MTTKHNQQTRLQAVKQVRGGHKSVAEIASDFNVSPSTLRRWVKDQDTSGAKTPKAKHPSEARHLSSVKTETVSAFPIKNHENLPERPTALLVLGMHRSGTSVISRVLNILGAALPKTLAGASEGNETGHWESRPIMAFNDRLLEKTGSSWDDWRHVDLSQIGRRKLKDIKSDIAETIEAEFGQAPLFVLKDPRICRLPNLYLDVLDDMDIRPYPLIAFRNPLEVASSLKKRNDFSQSHSMLLWLRHVLDAEKASRPFERRFISYNQFLKNWQSGVKSLSAQQNFSFPYDLIDVKPIISEFLSAKHYHHRFKAEDVVLNPTMRGWISDSYEALMMLSQNPDAPAALAKLDSIRNEFNNAENIIAEIFADQNKTYNDQLETVQLENSEALSKQVEETEKLSRAFEQEKTGLAAQLEAEVQEKTGLAAQLEAEVQEKTGLAAQLAKFEAEHSLIMSRLDPLAGDNRDLAEIVSDIKIKKETLEQDLLTQTQTADRLLQNYNDIRQKKEQLEEGLTQQRQLSEQLLQEKENLIQEKERLEVFSQEISEVHNRAVHDVSHLNDVNLAFKTEINQLRERLAIEQKTVLKPLLRRSRSLVGKSLRQIMPDKWVTGMAFMLPTAEQKFILDTRRKESGAIALSKLEVLPAKQGRSRPDIFIFAIIGWHFRTQRPQHIARGLAELGYRVFYFEMDPPGHQTEIETLADNLYRIKLKLSGAKQIPAYIGQTTAEQEKAWLKAFYSFCDKMDATPFKHVLVQHPFWWQLAKLLPPEFHLTYECMDHVSGFENTTSAIKDMEHDMLQNCDALTVSASYLYELFRQYQPKDIIRNATELDHFRHPDLSALTDKFKFNRKSGEIHIGYVGAIAHWFDYKLIQKIARDNPDFHFHLAGAVTDDGPKCLGSEPNVTLYGEIPYAQAPAFLQQMDVLTIPFELIPIIQACDPVKFYEYSAQGKPTIATSLPELKRAENLIYFADTPEDFSRQIRRAYQDKDDPVRIEQLQKFAASNSWHHRTLQFDTVLSDLPRVSVVILAYGEAQLTIAALRALKEGGNHYPHMEIIIVDNGSGQEDLDKIADYAGQFSDVRIIENGENLGFAKGNNVGMKAATGEYVLLLNNDTFVSPGAIHAMVRHLRVNPNIGVVGPLTNNIGNEARVEIDYDSMEEMVNKSRALMTGYRNKYIETPVAAYFAVMFRRRDFDRFGLLPTDYGLGMFEDDDHCAQIRAHGLICALAEDAFVHHHLSASFSKIGEDKKQALFEQNREIYEQKWGKWTAHKYRDSRLASDLQFPNENLLK